MEIIATSDLHGVLPDTPACDLLIIAGDVCPVWDDHSDAVQLRWLVGEFSTWLKKQPAKRKVFIGGNHDFVLEHRGRDRIDSDYIGAEYLQDSEVEVDGLRIWGTPWVPHLPNWAFHADAARMQQAADDIPIGTDVVVSHGPPYGILDDLHPHAAHATHRVGADFMESAMRHVEPALFVCGHIHEQVGS